MFLPWELCRTADGRRGGKLARSARLVNGLGHGSAALSP